MGKYRYMTLIYSTKHYIYTYNTFFYVVDYPYFNELEKTLARYMKMLGEPVKKDGEGRVNIGVNFTQNQQINVAE